MEKHKNILYALVVILLILQLSSFLALTSQVSKVSSELDKTKSNINSSLTAIINDYQSLLDASNTQNQQRFSEISRNLDVQKSSFDQEIKLLKSSQSDFSEVIEEALKGVVSIATDRAAGTGFIVDSSGFIITNNHVIEGGKKIAVLTYDKRILPATLMGTDPERDLAVLKIEGEYDTLKLANSDKVQVGQKVIAIGNPLGLSFSVTEGIVSALNRVGPNGRSEYIQTDVSLNPGNSGGPLIDKNGEVIGINNFKVGNAESLGFALESNVVKDIVNDLANQTIIN